MEQVKWCINTPALEMRGRKETTSHKSLTERGWQTAAKIPISSGWSFSTQPLSFFWYPNTPLQLSCPSSLYYFSVIILPSPPFYSFSDSLLYTSPTFLVQFCFSSVSLGWVLLHCPHNTVIVSLLFQGLCSGFIFPITFKSFPSPPNIFCILLSCLLVFSSATHADMTQAPSTALRMLMTQKP